MAVLAGKISEAIGGKASDAQRAGRLAKSDLVTEMVLEFTDLQGIMGYHYALNAVFRFNRLNYMGA